MSRVHLQRRSRSAAFVGPEVLMLLLCFAFSAASANTVECGTAKQVNLEFTKVCADESLQVNNLHGADSTLPVEQRFRSISTVNGESIDLVLTLNEGSAIPKDKGMCKENDFGHIRMGEGDDVDIQFTFRSSETGEPVVVEEFTMSYFDIENSGNKQPSQPYEVIKVYDYDALTLGSNLISGEGFDSAAPIGDGKFTLIQANSNIKTVSNPTGATELNDLQKSVSVQAVYTKKSTFRVVFMVKCANTCSEKDERSITYSGYSNILEECQYPPKPPTSPPPAPPAQPCEPCDDTPPNYLVQYGHDCQNYPDDWTPLEKGCSGSQWWTNKKYCRFSCFQVGRGYPGDNCCNSPPPSPPTPPATPPPAPPPNAPPRGIRTDEDIYDAVKLWREDVAFAEERYGHITRWDTSRVTSLDSLFEDAVDFNEDITEWDVAAVESMNRAFSGASSFSQDLSRWQVTSLKTFTAAFNSTGLLDCHEKEIASAWPVFKVFGAKTRSGMRTARCLASSTQPSPSPFATWA